MTAPYWDDEPIVWDFVMFASAKGTPESLAGVVKDVKVQRKTKLDKKVAAGASGATITFKGYELTEVEFQFKVWTKKQLARLEKQFKDLLPDPKKKAPTPRDFYHPVLAIHGLKSLYVEEIDGPSIPGTEGIVEYTLKCVEWAPPPKAPKNQTTTAQNAKALNGGINQLLPQAPVANSSTTFGPPAPPIVPPAPVPQGPSVAPVGP